MSESIERNDDENEDGTTQDVANEIVIDENFIYRLRIEQLTDKEFDTERAIAYATRFNWRVEYEGTNPIAIHVPYYERTKSRNNSNNISSLNNAAIKIYDYESITDWGWYLKKRFFTRTKGQYGKFRHKLDLDNLPITNADIQLTSVADLQTALTSEEEFSNEYCIAFNADISPLDRNLKVEDAELWWDNDDFFFIKEKFYLTSKDWSKNLLEYFLRPTTKPFAELWGSQVVSMLDEKLSSITRSVQRLRADLCNKEHEIGRVQYMKNATLAAAQQRFLTLVDDLKTIPNVINVVGYNDHIRIYSSDIFWEHPQTKYNHYFGQYEIQLYFNELLKFRNLKQIVGSYPHPHISKGGSACLGGFDALLTSSYRELHYYNVVLIMMEYLRTMTPSDSVAQERLHCFKQPHAKLKPGRLFVLFGSDESNNDDEDEEADD